MNKSLTNYLRSPFLRRRLLLVLPLILVAAAFAVFREHRIRERARMLSALDEQGICQMVLSIQSECRRAKAATPASTPPSAAPTAGAEAGREVSMRCDYKLEDGRWIRDLAADNEDLVIGRRVKVCTGDAEAAPIILTKDVQASMSRELERRGRK